jgi:hypothetical protein
MFDRFSRSLSLARSSWDVLVSDKKLLLFPLLSGLACLLIVVLIFAPLSLALTFGGLMFKPNGDVNLFVAIPLLFVYYFVTWFVVIFCNSALVSCALMHFNGDRPTLGDGFRAAWSRLPQILAWSLVAASVGLLLKLIESVHEKLGQIVAAILGTGWAIMTFFVVPILVVEKVGPFEAIKRSVGLLKKTWGEALIGHIGLGFFMFLLFLPVLLLVALTVAVFANGLIALGIALVVLTALYLIVFAVVNSALNTIFLGAMYQYAAFEKIPVGFDEATIRSAFTAKA